MHILRTRILAMQHRVGKIIARGCLVPILCFILATGMVTTLCGCSEQDVRSAAAIQATIAPTASPAPTPTPKPTATPTMTPTQKPAAAPTAKSASQSGAYQSQQPDTTSQTVYITKTEEKDHRGSCRYLRKSKISISLSKAKARGYTPCSVCNP